MTSFQKFLACISAFLFSMGIILGVREGSETFVLAVFFLALIAFWNSLPNQESKSSSGSKTNK